MKFQIFTLLTALALGVAANPIAEPVEGAVGNKLEARRCDRTCTCISGLPQGQYCGYCGYITSGEVDDHVYECNPEGGCCDYGHRTSCGNYQGPC